MFRSFLFIFLFILPSIFAYSAQVALTFDDAPMKDMSLFSGDERTQKLIEVLNKYKIKTVFFSNTSKFSITNGYARMKKYDEAGHFIANHSHTHPNFNEISLQEFINDFNKADSLLRQFVNFKPWFRYPMLKHGNTIEKRDGMRKYLKEMNYLNGYVTLDVQDWFMASIVDKSIQNGGRINKSNLCNAYTDMIWDSMSYFNSKAEEILKRSPKHMLLLHENDLAALCIENLIQKITKEGWDLISPTNAIEDDIYKIQPNTLFSNNGQIAALYNDINDIKIHDPWSYPWNEGSLIREEFNKRNVFEH